jgi:hypothetical protein
MPSLCRAQITFPLFSVSSNQSASNTLYFSDSLLADQVIDAPVANTTITDLPLKLLAAWAELATVLSANLVVPGRLQLYDMSDPQPRVAIYDENFSPSRSTSAPLPAEVALCLSYRTTYVAGVAKARRRGRIYLGPFINGAGTSTTSAVPTRPNLGVFTPALLDFANVLLDNTTYADSNWVQYSPTTSTFGSVAEVWYDDAWDTQRARGPEPSTREVLYP